MHPIHFAANLPGKIIAALRGRYFLLSQTKQKLRYPIGYRSSWWSEATQIRTIALWGIFGGDFIESDGFCVVFVVECNQNFFIIEIDNVRER